MKMLLFQIAMTGIEMVIPAAVLLPILVLFAAKKRIGAGLTACYGLFLLYLCAVYTVTGLPTLKNISWDPEVYLIPIVGMAEDVKNSILNVALFVPMGFLLPLLCAKFEDRRKCLLFGLGATVLIELAQLLNFRLTDVNDVLTNFAGTWLGYWLAQRLPKQWRSKLPESPGLLYGVIGLVLAFQFFAQPYLLPIVWKWFF